MENTHNFLVPQTNLIGMGAIKDLPNELLSWKFSKALIVTDKNMITLGYVEQIEKILKSLFIPYDIFDGVLHEPSVDFVEHGVSYFDKGFNILKRDYGLLVSIGGGSVHDCAKAIGIVAVNGGSIRDYEGWNKIAKPTVPQICINTTSGTGAEISMSAVIADTSRRVKMVITSPKMTPYISVNDPIFMTSMPQPVTAGSGMDAVVQAIEAYVATEASPITDALALDALTIAFEYLPGAYDNGNDLQAREQMMYAALMAGMAFNGAGLGYTHALAHQLGGFYHLTHGFYCAVLLPYVIEYNAPSIPEERLMKLAAAMNIKVKSASKAVDRIMTALKSLNKYLNIPPGLRQMGIGADDLEELSVNASKDLTALTNPRKGSIRDIVNIYKSAM